MIDEIRFSVKLFQFLESICGFLEGFIFLTETKSYLLFPEVFMLIKGRARNYGNSNFSNQKFREFEIIIETKVGYIRHNVV